MKRSLNLPDYLFKVFPNLTLPHFKNQPPTRDKFLPNHLPAPLVRGQLVLPEPGIGRGGLIVPRTPVPETTVDEHRNPAGLVRDVGTARDSRILDSVAQAPGMQQASNDKLRFGVLAPDGGHHGTPSGRIHDVHTGGTESRFIRVVVATSCCHRAEPTPEVSGSSQFARLRPLRLPEQVGGRDQGEDRCGGYDSAEPDGTFRACLQSIGCVARRCFFRARAPEIDVTSANPHYWQLVFRGVLAYQVGIAPIGIWGTHQFALSLGHILWSRQRQKMLLAEMWALETYPPSTRLRNSISLISATLSRIPQHEPRELGATLTPRTNAVVLNQPLSHAPREVNNQ